MNRKEPHVQSELNKKYTYDTMTDLEKQNLNALIEKISNGDFKDFATDFSFHGGVIDSRDIQDTIDDLQTEYDDLVEAYEDATDDDDEAAENLANWLEENGNAFTTLLACKEEVEQYTSEWDDGAYMIADNHFEDYAQELAEDTGAIDRKAKWPLTHIDWDAAAEELKYDYAEVTIAGRSYWVR